MEAVIRKIMPEDNRSVAGIIRTVMPEFGAGGQGFAIHDKEVDNMFNAYTGGRSAYFVCQIGESLVGGGGIGPLVGGGDDICELKKMYFLPEGRGRGLGQKLLNACLQEAKELGYKQCYLETFNTMNNAMNLYERSSFQKIGGPMGNTGHFACDIFYVRQL